MYYSAESREANPTDCVGIATSKSVKGLYTHLPKPFACPLDNASAIDAAGYQGDDGTWYVTYKVDGNRLNTDNTMHPTPIMLQKTEADAVTPVGEPIQLVDHSDADGPLIEAPSIVKHGGVYYMGFSSNMFDTMYYDMSWAYAKAITGPWTKSSGPGAPLLVSGDSSSAGPLGGPGGADFREDGQAILFHAFNNGTDPKEKSRGMWAANIKLEDGKITLV